jgi:hypothetical protein
MAHTRVELYRRRPTAANPGSNDPPPAVQREAQASTPGLKGLWKV